METLGLNILLTGACWDTGTITASSDCYCVCCWLLRREEVVLTRLVTDQTVTAAALRPTSVKLSLCWKAFWKMYDTMEGKSVKVQHLSIFTLQPVKIVVCCDSWPLTLLGWCCCHVAVKVVGEAAERERQGESEIGNVLGIIRLY